jgi:hypothetical protein
MALHPLPVVPASSYYTIIDAKHPATMHPLALALKK